MLILRAKIALNAVICMIIFIFSLIMESWLLRNVGFYRSFLPFQIIIMCERLPEKRKQITLFIIQTLLHTPRR